VGEVVGAVGAADVVDVVDVVDTVDVVDGSVLAGGDEEEVLEEEELEDVELGVDGGVELEVVLSWRLAKRKRVVAMSA
jgi:hypothetical protein